MNLPAELLWVTELQRRQEDHEADVASQSLRYTSGVEDAMDHGMHLSPPTMVRAAITAAVGAAFLSACKDGDSPAAACGDTTCPTSQVCCIDCDGHGQCGAPGTACLGMACLADGGVRDAGSGQQCAQTTCVPGQVCCIDCDGKGTCGPPGTACAGFACDADGGPFTTTTACEDDSDCTWRSSGCCGLCANKTADVPPSLPCGAMCPGDSPDTFRSQCLCENKHCVAGSLQEGNPCDLQRDLCGDNLKCCATCCGMMIPPDGGENPQCMKPQFNGTTPECPPLA